MFNTITILFALFSSVVSFGWNARYVGDAPIRWHSDTNTVGFKFQASSIPPSSAFRFGIMEAINLLNQNPSNIRIRVNPDTEWVSVGNGQNEVWFTDNNLVHDGAPAVCISHFNPFAFGVWNLMETDVIFNTAETYTASRTHFDNWSYNGPFRSIQGAALHEFGHAMGLSHENRIYNIMGEEWTHANHTGSRVLATRGPDMGDGLIRIYGGKTAPETVDLSVSNFKYLGTSGEYSTHQRTQLRGAIAAEPVTSFMAAATDPRDPNQIIFRARPNQLVLVEFTFENNGLNSISGVRTRYVLSSNRTITTLDQNLLETTNAYTRVRPVTRVALVRLPADLVIGARVYLGVIVDSTNAFAEETKRNNTTYIPIDVI